MHHSPGFLKLVNRAKSKIRECNVSDVAEKLKNREAFHLVDTREESEWDNGHIAGAIHLSKGTIERDIERKIPDHDAEIILYCGGGFRSALSAEALQDMGYTNVLSMDGGWRHWIESDLPTER